MAIDLVVGVGSIALLRTRMKCSGEQSPGMIAIFVCLVCPLSYFLPGFWCSRGKRVERVHSEFGVAVFRDTEEYGG